MKNAFLLIGIVFLPAAELSAQEKDRQPWNQFLGAKRDGHSSEKGLNLDWKKKPPKILWKSPIGTGFSSFSFDNGRIFTMAEREKRIWVICLEVDKGTELWATDVAAPYLDVQKFGPGPRATPTVNAGKLYCQLPMGELICVDVSNGKVLWQKDIFAESGARNPHKDVFYWGVSASPLIEGDAVVVQPGGDKGNSVMAFHKDTGKKMWMSGSDPIGYASPIAVTVDEVRQLVVTTGKSVLGIEPNKGEVLWRYPLDGNNFNCNCATPLWDGGHWLFVSSAYGQRAAGLDLRGKDGKTSATEKWKNKILTNQFATSILVGDYLYGTSGLFGGHGLRCVDLASGKEKWFERRPAKSSWICAEGHLIGLEDNGTLHLYEASPTKAIPKGELNSLLESSKAWTLPALSGRRLYVRDDKNLFCFDLSK